MSFRGRASWTNLSRRETTDERIMVSLMGQIEARAIDIDVPWWLLTL